MSTHIDAREITDPAHAADEVVEPITLCGDEVHMARSAVRRYLHEIAAKYRREVRRGNPTYIKNRLAQFDRVLDLFERLGGDPDTIPDPEDQPIERQDTNR